MESDINLYRGIEDLIKNDGELENILASQLENLEKWRRLDLSLSNANWHIGSCLQDVKKENEHLSNIIKEINNALEDCIGRFKLVKSENFEKSRQLWQQFVVNSEYYRNILISAQQEYKAENLVSDIQRYNAILEEINQQKSDVLYDIGELTSKIGLNKLDANPADNLNDKLFIDSLKKDQLSMSLIIRSYENDERYIANKIEQKEREIMELINKKKYSNQ